MSSSAPTAYSTVLYPNSDGLNFDMEYYLSTHMPLCARVWGPYGLKSWQAIKFEKHPNGSSPPFAVQAILHWSKPEDLQVVTNMDVSKPAFDDVKNYTNEKPIFMVGQWTGSSEC